MKMQYVQWITIAYNIDLMYDVRCQASLIKCIVVY